MKIAILSACALAAVVGHLPGQDLEALRRQIDELTTRVDELEDQQATTSERIGARAVVQAYNANTLDLGGHVSSLFTHMHGENRDVTGHVVTILELYLRAQLDEQWSLFATPGFYTYNGAFLDDPTTATRGDPGFKRDGADDAHVLFTRAYAQWKPDDLFQLRAGIIGSPHGTTNREFFIPARSIGLGSLHTRVYPFNLFYPQLLEGFGASGKFVLPNSSDWLEYDAYVGVQQESPDDLLGGLRLAWVFDDLGLSAAVNYGTGRRPSATNGLTGADQIEAALRNVPALQGPFATRVLGSRDYDLVGVDIDWRTGPLISKTEAYVSAEGQYDDQRVFSTEWTWFARPEWGLTYRFDYYDGGSDETVVSLAPFATAPMDRGRAIEHVVGISYNPNAGVRIRLDAHHIKLPRTGDVVDFLNFGWSVSF
ncbi:MAG: hypothetical protein KDE27_10065 [Planctomycetes bacterium]|nr:hypothetical protein [Planctomycetota bacterium]